MKIPTEQFTKIANKFPLRYREDLIQDMILLYLESDKEKQDSKYIFKIYPLRCKNFIKNYQHNSSQTFLLDDNVCDEDGENIRFSDMIESDENVEEKIIQDDIISQLKISPEERLVQQLYYIQGYSVLEIIEYFSHKTFVTSQSQIYKILKKGK